MSAKKIILLSCSLFIAAIFTNGFAQKVNRKTFFTEDKPLELRISTDLKNLLAKREQKLLQPATVTMRFPDSTSITESINLQSRGIYRLANCFMPAMMLHFKSQASPRLGSLKKLKLVCGCGATANDEQLIIKEYLAYKIYNLLTPMSFRVRLVNISYDDSRDKIKKYTQYGFFIEDVDQMAARNKSKEVEGIKFNTESTDREQMTMVALYQYMIGNTDWSVPAYHNIKLLRYTTDSVSFPFVVPYDFDYAGIVDAPYAVPDEGLGTENVKQRVYRGYPRTPEELEKAFAIFRREKNNIWNLVNNCAWLTARMKKETIRYLEEFYDIISSKSQVRSIFIENARHD